MESISCLATIPHLKVVLPEKAVCMMADSKTPHKCEHCVKSYSRRGPKSAHKFSIHYGGYDCDKCTSNFRFKELLNKHYEKHHDEKTNPHKDFGHLSKAQREELDTIGLKRKSLGLPPVVVEHLPPPMECESQENNIPSSPPVAETSELPRGNPTVRDQSEVNSPNKVDSVETLVDFDQCNTTDIVDLDATSIASQ